jgi:chromosome partitioning protein
MRRVVFNQKGGVGKSTIACNIASIAAARGKRTLLLDLDPQGNASRYLLGAAWQAVESSGADFFKEMLDFTFSPKGLPGCVHATPFENLSILPSSAQLAELQVRLQSRYKTAKLAKALDAIEDEYDEVIIDTPPALNFYSMSALIAAESCLIPFDCDDFSREALYKLMFDIGEIRDDHNEKLHVGGIVVNQFQPRARLPRQLVAELIDEGLPLLEPYLSSSVVIRESHQRGLPMIHLDRRHKLSAEFEALYDALTGEVREAQPA